MTDEPRRRPVRIAGFKVVELVGGGRLRVGDAASGSRSR